MWAAGRWSPSKGKDSSDLPRGKVSPVRGLVSSWANIHPPTHPPFIHSPFYPPTTTPSSLLPPTLPYPPNIPPHW